MRVTPPNWTPGQSTVVPLGSRMSWFVNCFEVGSTVGKGLPPEIAYGPKWFRTAKELGLSPGRLPVEPDRSAWVSAHQSGRLTWWRRSPDRSRQKETLYSSLSVHRW